MSNKSRQSVGESIDTGVQDTDRSRFTTRRAALGLTAAATAGILAERTLSPETARAEGVTSVNGQMGVVVLTAANVEGVPSVAVQALATSNVETKGLPAKSLTDEVTLAEGQLVLLTGQTTASQNGVWVVMGGSTKWTRPAAFATNSEQYGVMVPVLHGAKHGGSIWLMKNSTKIKIDTGATEWEEDSISAKAIEASLPGVVSTTAKPLVFGVNGAYGDYATWTAAGVLGDRGGNIGEGANGLAIEYNASAAEVKKLVEYVGERLEKGLTSPVVLINTGGKENKISLGEIVPATYAEKFVSIVSSVMKEHPGATVFEIINEPWEKGERKNNASRYGEICKATYEKVEEAVSKKELPSMPTLLVAAFGRYVNAAGEFREPEEGHGWIIDLYSGWSEGKKKINGWSCHPYGWSYGVYNGQSNGLQSAAAQHATIVAQGGSGANNVWITECGYDRAKKTEGGEELTEAEQAAKIQHLLETAWEWYAEGWLKAVMIYNNESAGWGIFGTSAQATLTTFASARRAPLLDIGTTGSPAVGIAVGPQLEGFTAPSAFGVEVVANATRPVWVYATVELEASKEGIAETVVKNPGSETEGTLTLGKVKQPAALADATEHMFTFLVPAGWKWQIKGKNGKITHVSYQVV
ncbi:MAG TPA: hypothetical protein VGL37_08300 [Solirubrobacteraceae bacterium]